MNEFRILSRSKQVASGGSTHNANEERWPDEKSGLALAGMPFQIAFLRNLKRRAG